MQALRDHLGPDEDVRFARLERAKGVAMRVLARHRVRVHPGDARLGKDLRNHVLHPFRAKSAVANRRIATVRVRTTPGCLLAVTAEMAHQQIVPAMKGQREAAVRTFANETAFRTEHRAGEPPPIQKKNGLLPFFEPRRHRRAEFFGKHRRSAGILPLGLPPHIDDADDRHLPVIDARREIEQRVFAGGRVMVALERGRRAAEQDGAALELGAHDGDIPGVIARRLLLLVGSLVFLIHDDDSRLAHRRKNRAACANDDASLARMNAMPFIVPFALGKSAVQHRHRVARAGEPALEPLDRLRRQGNLRHQHERAPTLRARHRDGLQVDLRLAAAGDPVQQHWLLLRARRPHHVAHFAQSGRLLWIQRQRRVGKKRIRPKRIARDRPLLDRDVAQLDQPLQRLAGRAVFLKQLDHLHALGRRGLERGEQFGAARRSFRQRRRRLFVGRADQTRELAFLEIDLRLANHVGQHAPHRLVERRAIVIGNPARQFQQHGRDRGLVAYDRRNRTQFSDRHFADRGQRDDGAEQLPLPKRQPDAASHLDQIRHGFRDRVIEFAVGRAIHEDARETGVHAVPLWPRAKRM